jgi:CTP synthase (UTP-ammonia lyase)
VRRIALVGDFRPEVAAHRAIPLALGRAATDASVTLRLDWIDTATIGRNIEARLAGYTGVWVVPASPYADTGAALAAIRHARWADLLCTCGFQHDVGTPGCWAFRSGARRAESGGR